MNEPALYRMEPLVDAVLNALLPLTDRPVALFGHSMGAWVGYELALRLERIGVIPRLLAVSGQVAPSRRKPRAHGDADTEILAELERLGGYDPDLFEDPDLRELLLEPIRADFSLVRSYQPAGIRAVSCPVLACAGDADDDCAADDVQAWEQFTLASFTRWVFPGGHFYLVDQERALLQELSARLGPVPHG